MISSRVFVARTAAASSSSCRNRRSQLLTQQNRYSSVLLLSDNASKNNLKKRMRGPSSLHCNDIGSMSSLRHAVSSSLSLSSSPYSTPEVSAAPTGSAGGAGRYYSYYTPSSPSSNKYMRYSSSSNLLPQQAIPLSELTSISSSFRPSFSTSWSSSSSSWIPSWISWMSKDEKGGTKDGNTTSDSSASKSNLPRGFEHWFPKDFKLPPKTSKNPSSPNSRSSDKKSSDPAFASKDNSNKNKQDNKQGSTGGGGGGNIPPNQDDDMMSIPSLLTLLFLVIAARQFLERDGDGEGGGGGSSDGRNGKEITFVEFRNHLLETGQVEKIVVVNQQLARIVLHPGSRGIVKDSDGSTSTTWSSNEHDHEEDQSSSSKNAKYTDTTVMDFNSSPADDHSSSTAAASTTTLRRHDTGTAQHAYGNVSSAKTPRYYFNIGSVESFEEKLSKSQSMIHPREWVPVQYVSEINLLVELIKATPMIVMMGILYYYTRGMFSGGGAAGGFGAGGGSGGAGGGGGGPGGIFQMGKSTAKKVNPENVKVSFKDVAGCQQAKIEIMEFVDFLQDSTQFTKLGAKIPKGALLCGPPGTGKTLLAKAVAGEAGVPFYSISGSDFLEMFVGVGPSRVRDLFKEARANSPCIVFIDEIDAVGRQRGRGGFSGGGNDERENTLNQLLVEMDGFTSTTGIVVLAGTNRVDILDQALTRPGRFDRQITVDKPDLQGRKEIFQVHLRGITLESPKKEDETSKEEGESAKPNEQVLQEEIPGSLADDVKVAFDGKIPDETQSDASASNDKDKDEDEKVSPIIELVSSRLAGLTPGFAGADIANLVNEAAIVAARRKAEFVAFEDFEKATDRIIGGLESNKIMSDQERSIVAYHEAGHAVAGWFLEHADPLLKVTIIPRSSGALGFAQYLPKEVFLRTEAQIMDLVCMALAGRAAEQVFFGKVTTGASDDLRRVTQLVYSTIQNFGMNSRVGQLSFPQNDNQNSLGGDKPYSQATAEAMDEEARRLVTAAYERTVKLIEEKKHEVESVAKLLMDKETITHDDIVDLIGDRPFVGDPQYQEYVSARKSRTTTPAETTTSGATVTGEDGNSTPEGEGGVLNPGLA